MLTFLASEMKSLLSISLLYCLLALSADSEEKCAKSIKVSINLENCFIKLFALTCDIWIGDKDDKPTTTLYFKEYFSTSLKRNHFAELQNSLSFDYSIVFSLLRTYLAPKPTSIDSIDWRFSSHLKSKLISWKADEICIPCIAEREFIVSRKYALYSLQNFTIF